MKDKIVEKVLESYKKRSKIGIDKYGTTMERNDLSLLEWLNHLQEELMDATLYIEKLKEEEEKRNIAACIQCKSFMIKKNVEDEPICDMCNKSNEEYEESKKSMKCLYEKYKSQ